MFCSLCGIWLSFSDRIEQVSIIINIGERPAWLLIVSKCLQTYIPRSKPKSTPFAFHSKSVVKWELPKNTQNRVVFNHIQTTGAPLLVLCSNVHNVDNQSQVGAHNLWREREGAEGGYADAYASMQTNSSPIWDL